jgi:hypothetical protein
MHGLLLLSAFGAVGGMAFPTTTTQSQLSTTTSISTTTAPIISLTSAQALPPFQSTVVTTVWSSDHPVTKTYLYLPVTTAAPDPLGISKVSGVYGPGAWAAWFLTGVGSWLRVVRGAKGKIDVNMAMFLLGTNWAAADVLRSIRILRSLPADQPGYDAGFMKSMGNYGAAFTVMFWGTFHAYLQLASTSLRTLNGETNRNRIRMLLLGLLLPVYAHTATAYGAFAFALTRAERYMVPFPALYWKGMQMETHLELLLMACSSGMFLLAIGCLFIYFDDDNTLLHPLVSGPVGRIRLLIKSTNGEIWFWLCLSTSGVLATISIILARVTSRTDSLWGAVPFALMMLPVIAIVCPVLVLYLPLYSVVYVLVAYFHLGSNASESCFFMPCAPQSITDEDQLYPLLGGSIFLLAFDVIPPVKKELKKRYRENREFFRDVERRLREFQAQMQIRTSAASDTSDSIGLH